MTKMSTKFLALSPLFIQHGSVSCLKFSDSQSLTHKHQANLSLRIVLFKPFNQQNQFFHPERYQMIVSSFPLAVIG